MSSAELSKARKQLIEVRSLIKQNRLLPAVQCLSAAVGTMIRTSLIKNERTELEDMVRDAVGWISHSDEIRKIFPLAIVYTPGDEEDLLNVIQELLNLLENEMTEQANVGLKLLEERKRKLLAQAQEHLNKGEVDKAAAVHQTLTKEFGEDQALLSEIGEQYLKAEKYEQAFEYLSKALEANPEAIHLYNRIGIALRKLERYEIAEKYYKKALEIAGKDIGLLFNLSRLYVEWKQWAKAEKAATLTIKISPDFVEGKKLLAYIEKHKS